MAYVISRPLASCSITCLIPYFQVTSPVFVSPCEIYLAYRGVSWESIFHLSRVTYVVVVQSLSRVRLFATLWTAARQASLSITNSRSLLKLMSVKSVMPSNHLILCRPLLLLPLILPSIRVFSDESVLRIRCPKYWSFGFSVSPSNEVNDACVCISIYMCSYMSVQACRY